MYFFSLSVSLVSALSFRYLILSTFLGSVSLSSRLAAHPVIYASRHVCMDALCPVCSLAIV
jgi:hypothetical protein